MSQVIRRYLLYELALEVKQDLIAWNPFLIRKRFLTIPFVCVNWTEGPRSADVPSTVTHGLGRRRVRKAKGGARGVGIS